MTAFQPQYSNTKKYFCINCITHHTGALDSINGMCSIVLEQPPDVPIRKSLMTLRPYEAHVGRDGPSNNLSPNHIGLYRSWVWGKDQWPLNIGMYMQLFAFPQGCVMNKSGRKKFRNPVSFLGEGGPWSHPSWSINQHTGRLQCWFSKASHAVLLDACLSSIA